MQLEVGTTYYRYQLLAPLGEGGMARVYRVRHLQLGTEHALKVLVSANKDIRERLLHEGRVQAALKHPNIVNVTDVIDVEEMPGLIMELVDGPTLEELLHSRRLTVKQLDLLATGILEGMAFAHRKRLIHRDLKPANILCAIHEGALIPKIADFGLVKVLGGEGEGMHNTRSGMMMGTPHYMSPEQIRDSKRVDERADVWALGVILYRMTTGALPFSGDSVFDIMTSASAGDFQPVLEVTPDLPERMANAIAAALQVNPEKRPMNAVSLLELWTGTRSNPGADWAGDLVGDYGSTTQNTIAPPSSGAEATLSGMYQPSKVNTSKPPAVTLSPVTHMLSEETWGPESQPLAEPEESKPNRRIWGVFGLATAAFLGVAGWFAMQPVQPVNAPDPTPIEATPVQAQPAPVVAPAAQPTETPEATAAPVIAAPRPAPAIQPRPRPRPRPRPAAKAAATPEPEPIQASVIITAEPEPPKAATTALFSVKGDAEVVYLTQNGQYRYPDDEIEPGTWELWLQSDSSSTAKRLRSVTIQAGDTLVFHCSAASANCK